MPILMSCQDNMPKRNNLSKLHLLSVKNRLPEMEAFMITSTLYNRCLKKHMDGKPETGLTFSLSR